MNTSKFDNINIFFDNLEILEEISNSEENVSKNGESETQLLDLSKLGYEEILITDTPTQDLWEISSLYNISQIGKDMIWKIYVEPDKERLVIIHGYIDGKKQTDYVNIVLNKSNKDFQAQALQDAKKRYNDKLSSGYNPKFSENTSIIKFQLANNYISPTGTKGKTNISFFPVCIQSKIDGIRAASYMRDGEFHKTSRTNKLFKPMWFDNQLKILLTFLPPNVMLDGEMYSSEINFNEISSIVRTVKTYTPDEIKIKYYIFDIIMLNTTLEERITKLTKAYENYKNAGNIDTGFIILNSYTANNYREIEEAHEISVSMGYEGIMIRNYSTTKNDPKFSYYKGGRNNNLLKYKHFIDEEAVVVDITSCEEDNKKMAMFVIKDIRGNIFTIRPNGKFEDRIKALNNKNDYIGKQYTFKYFELTPDKIPRFPTGKGFREDF